MEDELFAVGARRRGDAAAARPLTNRDLPATDARPRSSTTCSADRAQRRSRCALATYAVVGGRARDLVRTLDWLVDRVAEERGWRVARVRDRPGESTRAAREALVRHRSAPVGRPVELEVVRAGRPARRRDRWSGGPARRRHGRGPARRAPRAPDGRPARGNRLSRRTRATQGARLMAELTITSDGDHRGAQAPRRRVHRPRSAPSRSGRIIEVGDGIARVSGLPRAAVNELLEFEDGTVGLAMNLDEESIGAVVLGSVDGLEEEQVVKRDRADPLDRGRRRAARPRRERARRADRRQGADRRHPDAAHGGPGARDHGPPARERAAADRHQGHRRDDADRPRASASSSSATARPARPPSPSTRS